MNIMKRPAILLLSFFALCLASTLYLFGAKEGSETTDYRASYSKSPFQQHLDEAISNDADIAGFFNRYTDLSEKNSSLLKPAREYLDHIDTYFREARAQAQGIRDSALRAQMENLVAQKEAKVTAATANLRAAIKTYTTQHALLDDQRTAVRVVASIGAFEAYLEKNTPAVSQVHAATASEGKLLNEGRALVHTPQP